MSKTEKDEKRRLRTWMTAQIASALVRTFSESHPDSGKIASRSVFIADAVLAELDRTDPYKD